MSGKNVLQQKFDGYLDDLLDYAREELVESHTFTRSIRQREMERIDYEMRQQRDVALNYAEDMARGDANREHYVQQFLGSNPFLRHFSGPESVEENLKNDLIEHFEKVSEDLVPLIESNEDEFEGMVKDAHEGREEAQRVLEENFNYTDIIKGYGPYLNTNIGPFIVVNFVDEILPVIEEGREKLEQELSKDLDEIYD